MTLPLAYVVGVHLLALIGLVALCLIGAGAYALHDLRDEPAEPNPPRMGEPMMWRHLP